MSIGDSLNKNVRSWAVLAMTIVVVLIVLVKFKTVSGGACAVERTFNASGNSCYLTANTSQASVAINTAGKTIDLFVTGLSEPANWVAIVIIALIGFAIIKLVNKK